jgi:hypothetical protein
MFPQRPRKLLILAVMGFVLLVSGGGTGIVTGFDDDPPDAIDIRPPLGSATGSFEYLDQAIDSNESNGSIGSVAVGCRSTCSNNPVEKSGEWQGFPDGFEPLRLEVRWDAVGGISLASGRAARADLKLEFDVGNGWETAAEEAWVNQIPSCSEVYKSRCTNNVFVHELTPEQSTGAIKVRATVKAEMTACGNCGLFDTSHMNVIMAVRHIQIVARGPRLVAEPGTTVTRGDMVTFRVMGAPVSSYSNWRYQFQPIVHPDIVRTENINTGSWTGPLLLGGSARVVVIVPGHSVSIPLQTPVITVNPRSWNTPPEQPTKVTGITPSPPGVFSTANVNGHMGYFTAELGGLFNPVKLDGDGPNQGLSYVTWVKHGEDPLVHFSYEIAPDVESGTTFYSKQCGQGGFILGSVLRSNTYEHESGTQKGHYQQYRDRLADPAVNYAIYAEQQVGAVSQTLQAFENMVQLNFNSRRDTLHNAADVEACNEDVRYDPTCVAGNPNQGFRGNINSPPYQAPCQ